MTALQFRNIVAEPADPVQEWGAEGILTAIERGSLQHWRRIAAAVQADPEGAVADELEEALAMSESPGVTAVLARILVDARDGDRALVRRRVAAAVRRSGLPAARFAERVGTSPSRLSTYVTGKVVPSAVMLAKIEREGERLAQGV